MGAPGHCNAAGDPKAAVVALWLVSCGCRAAAPKDAVASRRAGAVKPPINRLRAFPPKPARC